MKYVGARVHRHVRGRWGLLLSFLRVSPLLERGDSHARWSNLLDQLFLRIILILILILIVGTTPILNIKNPECYSKLAGDKGKLSGRGVGDWKPRKRPNGTGVLVVSFFTSALIPNKGILHVVLCLLYTYSGINHVASPSFVLKLTKMFQS